MLSVTSRNEVRQWPSSTDDYAVAVKHKDSDVAAYSGTNYHTLDDATFGFRNDFVSTKTWSLSGL